MTAADLQSVIKGIGPVIREYVATAMLSFGTRLSEIEARAVIPGPPGKDGERGLTGDKGDRGEAGLDADRSEIDALKAQLVTLQAAVDHERAQFTERVQMVVSESLAQRPVPADGKDGTSVTVADVLPVIRAEVQQAIAALPPVTNGRDGQDGRNGVDGKNGRSVTLEDLAPVVAQAVEQTVATWPKPKDGTSVTVNDVAPIIAAEVDKAVAALPAPKDPVGVLGALIDRDGALVMTLSDGTVKTLGCVVGRDVDMAAVRALISDELASWPRPKDGVDGLGFEDLTFATDDAGKLVARFQRGDVVRDVKLPGIYDCGVYKDGTQYERGDAVTWRRSIWIAQEATAAMPDTGGAGARPWRLAVPAARDGKDGKAGPVGPVGPMGRAGQDLTQLGRDGQKW
jgi:hypothetical protein